MLSSRYSRIVSFISIVRIHHRLNERSEEKRKKREIRVRVGKIDEQESRKEERQREEEADRFAFSSELLFTRPIDSRTL